MPCFCQEKHNAAMAATEKQASQIQVRPPFPAFPLGTAACGAAGRGAAAIWIDQADRIWQGLACRPEYIQRFAGGLP